MATKILLNCARCKLCNTKIISADRHDMVYCLCRAVAVDGGNDYLRRIGNEEDMEELSELEED